MKTIACIIGCLFLVQPIRMTAQQQLDMNCHTFLLKKIGKIAGHIVMENESHCEIERCDTKETLLVEKTKIRKVNGKSFHVKHGIAVADIAAWDIFCMENGDVLRARILDKNWKSYKVQLDTGEEVQLAKTEIVRVNDDFLRLRRVSHNVVAELVHWYW